MALGVAVSAGGVYVVGFTGDTLPGQVSAGGGDAFIRKYDVVGNEVWTRQFGTNSADQAKGVAVDDGGVYVAGFTSTALPGQVSAGNADAFVRKYDALGNEVWTRQFGTSSLDQAFGITVDASGVYVAGETRGGTFPGQVNAGGTDAFVRKYDMLGNEVWTRQFGSTGSDDALGVAVDASGVYVAGLTRGILPGQVSGGALVRKYDAVGNEVWTRQFGSGSDVAFGVATGANSVYVAGRTSGTLPGQVSAGGTDAFVRNYDPLGNEVWTRQFGAAGPAPDFASAVDSDGNVYVAGQTDGTLQDQVNGGDRDVFVRKYDALGNEVWTRQFGTTSTDEAFGVAVDANGVYVAGQTGGTFPGQVSAGGLDAFVRKYDALGNEVWTRQFGSSSSDWAFSIAVDGGGVYAAGFASAPLPGQAIGGSFVRKYDGSGNEVWTRQFGFTLAFGVAADAGGVYVSGLTFGTLPGQVSAGGLDAFVRKYDALGNEVWTRQFGSSSTDQAMGIAVDAGSVYVAGLIDGTSPTFPPGQLKTGSGDAFVRKYDTLGTEVWTRQFGSSSFDQANGVTADGSGVYVAGETLGTLPSQFSAGGRDAFVRKYDTLGTEVWTRQVGTSSSDQANGVAVDAGDVYVTGTTFGALPGQVSAGGSDAFVIKYSQNRPPIADAGPDSIVECAGPSGTAVTLGGIGSSDPDNDPITFAWSAPGITFDDPASPTPTGTFPLGTTTTVTLEVTDPSEESDLDAVDITVEDTTAPEIEAALMPVGGSGGDDDDGGSGGNVFVVSVLGTDLCDTDPIETACIVQPLAPTDPFELKFKMKKGGDDDDDDGGGGNVKNEIKIKFKKNKIKVELKGQDQQFLEDLLNQAIQKGGFPVIDGQEVKLVAKGGGDDDDDDDGGGGGTWKFVFDANGNLISGSGPGPNLRAFATDASGNVSDVLEVPVPGKGKGKKHAKLAKIGTRGGNGLGSGLDPLSGSPEVRFALDSREPLSFRLGQNFPNPFNPETTIRYAVPEASEVRLTIYNIQGQEVRVLINASHSAGRYNTRWDGRDASGRSVSTGVYLYRLEAGTNMALRKMVFVK